ncbi:MAG: TetR/AcrR family transcriptional regulator [Thermoleophilaceae bacterium]|nr:TetR/AcrR family transcriptional regulator [Thermoleophilaceae bacterium]
MASQGTFTIQEPRGAERRAATRQLIVQAVSDLLGDGVGFAELSVARIVERAGVSRATFYLHFSDKRELLAGLAEQELASWQEIAEPLFANPDADRDAVVATIAAMVAMWQEHRPILAALIELAEYDDAAREAWQTVIGAVAAAASHYTENRQDFDIPDPEMANLVVTWMFERSCHKILAGADAVEVDRLVQALAEVLWRSRKPNP